MNEPIKCSSLREYLEKEIREMTMGDNPYYAWLEIGHSPNLEECARHYTKNHGDIDFGRRYYIVFITNDSDTSSQ